MCVTSGTTPSNWSPIGPFSQPSPTTDENMGIITGLWVDPTNSSNIMVGSNSGGFFTTTNGGTTWSNPDVSRLPCMGISSITVDPTSSNQTIYVSTNFAAGYSIGILKSTDGGVNWGQTSMTMTPTSSDTRTWVVCMDPNNPLRLYTVTDKVLYRTTDGFVNTANITDITPTGASPNAYWRSVVTQPVNGNTDIVYLTGNELHMSTNQGNTFTRLDNIPSFGTVPSAPTGYTYAGLEISICPVVNSTLSINGLYANAVYTYYLGNTASKITQIKFYNQTTGLWTSSVQTISIAEPSAGLLVVNPNNPNIIYSETHYDGGLGRTVCKSVDGGLNFSPISSYLSNYLGGYTHCDIRKILLYTPSAIGNATGNQDILYVADDGGLLKNVAGGTASWLNLNGTGLNITQFYGFGGSEILPSRIVGGSQDNGLYTYNSGSWSVSVVGDAYDGAIDQDNQSIMFGTQNGGSNKLYKTSSGGISWANIPQPSGASLTTRPISADINNTWYAGYNDLWRSYKRGAFGTWVKKSDFIGIFNSTWLDANGNIEHSIFDKAISSVAQSSCDSNYIYVGFSEPTWGNDQFTGTSCGGCPSAQARRLFMTTNGTSTTPTWIDITEGLTPVEWKGITGIAINPNDPNEIWVSFNSFWETSTGSGLGMNRVFHGVVNTTTGTCAWNDYSTGLPWFPTTTIVCQNGTNKGLYLGTDVGIFYRDASMSAWECFSTGIPVGMVPEIEINYCAKEIRASVYGRGLWVSPLPPSTLVIPVTVSPNPICEGQTSTLTATTTCGYTYKWYSAATGGTSLYTGGVFITPALTTTTTYYVEAITEYGCAGPRTAVTVNVSPKPVVTIPGNVSVCTGTVVAASNFTSIPAGATYAWTSSNTAIGLSTTSGTTNIPSFTATNAGSTLISSTITVTATLAGCVTNYTYTITVTPSNCVGTTQISTAIGNNNILTNTTLGTAGMTYKVLDDITINSPAIVTIISPDMRFDGGKKITVKSGATLIVSGAWLHACSSCRPMWAGIVLERGGHLQVINGSVIEDALNAIETNTTGSGVPDYTINQAIFNKNAVNIKVALNTGDMSANTIKNAIFTCRNIITPTPGTFASNFSTQKTALLTNNPLSLSAYPIALTIAGTRSVKGVELNSLSYITAYPKIGNAPGGATDRNVFDNLDYGVYLNAARCEIKNSTFQNLKGNQPSYCHGCTPIPPYGIAVYAPAQTNQLYTSLVIGGSGSNEANAFYDCYRGMEISNYYSVDATYNTLVCSSTPGTTTFNTIANVGIYLKDIQENVLVKGISTAPITNWVTGVWFVRNTGTTGTLNPAFIIDGNTISANSAGSCTQAILVTDIATTTNVATVQIKNNTITDVKNGIKVSNIKNNMVVYNNPSIALRYTSSGTVHGIYIESCDKAEVKNNVINSLKAGTYTSPDNWELRGIYVKTSTNNKIFCNNISSVGECMVFESGCLSTSNSSYGGTTNGILGNEMTNARTGLMLRTSGVIGQQGSSVSPGFPSSNHWNGSPSAFSNGQTFTLSSSAPTSGALYCLSTTTSQPSNNTGSGTFTAFASPVTLIPTTGTEITCPSSYVPAGMASSSGSGFRSMEASAYVEELKQLLALNTSANDAFIPNHYLMQQFIYNEIRDHKDLQTDSTLNFFYLSKLNTAMDQFRDVDDEMLNQNYTQALVNSNNALPSNVIEENQFTFNRIYIPRCDSAITYTEEEIIALYDIANQCGLEGGNAVYQSRNLLMFIANNVIEFTEDCDDTFNDSRAVLQTPNVSGREIKLYPNPNNGIMQLDCNLTETESGSLIIYDSNGKEVKNYPLNPSAKTIPVNAQSLKQGSYMYEVIVNGRKIKRDKLILIK
ncbi:MAG TPA: T9SS type A sorting domain-containing protein [Bacteroidia bacterium]